MKYRCKENACNALSHSALKVDDYQLLGNNTYASPAWTYSLIFTMHLMFFHRHQLWCHRRQNPAQQKT